jgi:hypothetical protein
MTFCITKLLFCISILNGHVIVVLAESGSSSAIIIQLKAGQIRGRQESVPRGADVDVFLGIPYTQPPIGELRFASPRPAKPWNGILDATEFGAHCPQGETIGRGILAGKCILMGLTSCSKIYYILG